jgi:hypothetical protein
LKTEGSASPQFFSSDSSFTPGVQVPLPPVAFDLPVTSWSIVIQTHNDLNENQKYWVALLVSPDYQLTQTLAGVAQAADCDLEYMALDTALDWLRVHQEKIPQVTVVSSNNDFVETLRSLHEFDSAEFQSKDDNRYWERPRFWEPCWAKLEELGCSFSTQLLVTPYDSLLWNEQLIIPSEVRIASHSKSSSEDSGTVSPNKSSSQSVNLRETRDDSPPW